MTIKKKRSYVPEIRYYHFNPEAFNPQIRPYHWIIIMSLQARLCKKNYTHHKLKPFCSLFFLSILFIPTYQHRFIPSVPVIIAFRVKTNNLLGNVSCFLHYLSPNSGANFTNHYNKYVPVHQYPRWRYVAHTSNSGPYYLDYQKCQEFLDMCLAKSLPIYIWPGQAAPFIKTYFLK